MNKKLTNVLIKLTILALLPLLPATGMASSLGESKSILQAVSLDTSLDISLKSSDRVKAGEDFTISLVTGENFPLLLNQEVALFESFAGETFKPIKSSRLDKNGTAELTLKKSAAGDYQYQVRVGPFKKEIKVTVLPGKPAQIKGTEENFFLEVGRMAEVEFIVEDSFGNRIAAGNKSGQHLPEDLLQVSAIDPAHNAVEVELSSSPSENFLARFQVEKTGDYQVTASLEGTDILDTLTVHSREFGAVSQIELTVRDIDNGGQASVEPILRTGENAKKRNSLELETVLVGQYGFRRAPLTNEDINIFFSTNRPDLLLVEKTGGGKALITEKGKAGLATVTATYLGEDKGLQDNIDVRIVNMPSQIHLEMSIKDLTASVEATLLDKNGQPAYEETKEYNIVVPSGVNLISKQAFQNGKANFVLQAKDYGSYTVSMSAGNRVSRTFVLTFEQTVAPAGNAVIFVGQEFYFKDGEPEKISHAPWLSYGHVFVPVDFIADFFAVEILPSAKKIGFRGKNIEIIIDLDKSTLSLTEKGATKTQPIGHKFLQEKNNTYFVPAVIIARLLGAEADYFPKSGEIEHVSITLKP